MGFLYETHLHTAEVSRCARRPAEEQVGYYRDLGYAGLIVTDHFLNNCSCLACSDKTWEERIDDFCRGYDLAAEAGAKFSMDVMFGFEYSLHGNDFLVYGLTPEWLKAHPGQLEWEIRQYMETARAAGALVVHAHPFREADYIDMIRLLPRHVDGVEVYNANRSDFENERAQEYARAYGLGLSAGSDNHRGEQARLAGLQTEKRYADAKELIAAALRGEAKIFQNTPEEIRAGKLTFY